MIDIYNCLDCPYHETEGESVDVENQVGSSRRDREGWLTEYFCGYKDNHFKLAERLDDDDLKEMCFEDCPMEDGEGGEEE